MRTGSSGTFVIAWHQTELDGQQGAMPDMLATGATWRWHGEAERLDGPRTVLRLDDDVEIHKLRQRVGERLRRRTPGAGWPAQAAVATPPAEVEADDPENGFILTDGYGRYAAEIVARGGDRILLFRDGLPRAGVEHWVVRVCLPPVPDTANPFAGGVICFTPGTRIATPLGPQLIETLRPGDLILTQDDGPQPVLWTGRRRMSGARLFAMPHLRPVRFRAGALGLGRPDAELLVSPQHRMLLRGRAALSLFNTPEVLVAAEDLVDGRAIAVDTLCREVTYVHIALERHQVVWANGLETESFHPANTSLDTLEPAQREALIAAFPDLARSPSSYGDFARRNLAAWEAAVLRHDLAA